MSIDDVNAELESLKTDESWLDPLHPKHKATQKHFLELVQQKTATAAAKRVLDNMGEGNV